jgi:hypothetical protein
MAQEPDSGETFRLGALGAEMEEPQDEGEGDPLLEGLEQPPPAPPEPEPEPEPEGEGEPEPQKEGEEEPQPAPAAEEEEGEVDWEKRYKDTQATYTRQRQEMIEKDTRLAQLEAFSQQAAPILRQVLQQQQQAPAPSDPEEAEQQQAYQALQQLIRQEVQAGMRPAQQQAKFERENAEKVAAIVAYRQSENAIKPGSDEDYELAAVVKSLNLDVSADGSLQIAAEAVRDSNLRAVLNANPALIDSDETMDYARTQAKLLASVNAPQGSGTTPPAGSEQQGGQTRRVAHVETGGTGAPVAASDKPIDEMEEAIRAYKKDREGTGSIFFK